MSVEVNSEERLAANFFVSRKPRESEAVFFLLAFGIISVFLMLVFLAFNFEGVRADFDPSYKTYLTLRDNYAFDCQCEEGNLFLFSEDSEHATPLCRTDTNVFVPNCKFVGVIEE